MKLFSAFLLLGLSQALALSIHERRNAAADPRKAMENEGLFQGDIAGIDPFDRNAITSASKMWTDNKVYYQINSNLNNQRALIRQAMDQYETKTNGCLKFIESTGSGNYIFITLHNGCYSYVGMTGGRQTLSLGYGCHYIGTVVHELGHALGLHHEQNRSDRDKYLHINTENVSPSQLHNFQKLKPSQNFLMTPFDYNSIMEYGDKAFSSNGQPTIRVLDGTHTITEPYNKQGLTDEDAFIINSLYSCPGYTRPPPIKIPDAKCDFENGMCFFSNENGFAKATVVQEQQSSNHYLSADRLGQSYRFITPGFPLEQSTVCVSFHYKVDGNLDRQIYMIAYAYQYSFQKTLPGSNTNGWKSVKIQLQAKPNFRVYFDVTVGRTSPSAFGLDNFSVAHHAC